MEERIDSGTSLCSSSPLNRKEERFEQSQSRKFDEQKSVSCLFLLLSQLLHGTLVNAKVVGQDVVGNHEGRGLHDDPVLKGMEPIGHHRGSISYREWGENVKKVFEDKRQ